MAQINPPLVLVLLMCLARVVLSAPPETEQDATDATSPLSELVTVQYTEAVGTGDFTLGNTSSTFEEILAEVGLTDYDTRKKRRPCACTTTVGAHGGRQGTAFVDVPTNPCDVHITDIWVRHGGITDAIQVRYKFPNGDIATSPLRGGATGAGSHVSIPEGGKVIGLFGGVTNRPSYGLVISQLRILVLDGEQHLQIYGPFGSALYDRSGTFAVYGNIKSIFGYHRHYLDGLGVYYEPWGVCGSPCAPPEQGSGSGA